MPLHFLFKVGYTPNLCMSIRGFCPQLGCGVRQSLTKQWVQNFICFRIPLRRFLNTFFTNFSVCRIPLRSIKNIPYSNNGHLVRQNKLTISIT